MLPLYHLRISPIFVGVYKVYLITTYDLSHNLLDIQSLRLYYLRIIPLYIGEHKGYRFTNCDLSHFLLENTKSTALPLANYPTFHWKKQRLPL